MSMLVMIGFESGSISELDGGACTISATRRTGNYGLSVSGPTTGWKTFPARSEIYMQMAFTMPWATSQHILKWRKGSTVLGTLYFDSTLNKFKLYTGDGATLVATGSKQISINTWYVLELHIKIAAAGGELLLRIDGVPDASFTGNTKPGTDADIDSILFNATSGGLYYTDDVIINDTNGTVNISWPNSAKIVLLKPTGAGNLTQWTPSTAPNWECVNEVPVSASDFVFINADGQLDLYTLEDLPSEAKSVQAVRGDAWAWKSAVRR